MYAAELISDAIPPVHTSDTIQKVLDRMVEFRVRHLPIVNEEQFLGLIAESDMIARNGYSNINWRPGAYRWLTLMYAKISIYMMLSACFMSNS